LSIKSSIELGGPTIIDLPVENLNFGENFDQSFDFGFQTKTPFFGGTFVENLSPQLFFSGDQLHIILNHNNLEIGEHSSFSIIEEIIFSMEIP